jgi:hypothetical protein
MNDNSQLLNWREDDGRGRVMIFRRKIINSRRLTKNNRIKYARINFGRVSFILGRGALS